MNKKLWAMAALLILPLAQPAVSSDQDDEPSHIVVYQYALYLMPGYEGDPLQTAADLIREQYEQFSIIETFDEPPVRPIVGLTMLADAQQHYRPPDMEFIGYFGRGLTREQALAVQQSDNALIIDFAYPIEFASAAFLDALTIMERISRQHESLIWDEATREIFTANAWRDMRVETWNDGLPRAQDHTVIHVYQDDEYVRAITLGMAKFGLPDIVVNDFSWSLNQPMGNLINLVCQTLVEGRDFNDDLSLDLDVDAIRHDQIREETQATLLDNAEARIRLNLRPTEPDEGDPANFLLEIRFDAAAGATTQQKQEALLSSLFGWTDTATAVSHTEEILDASERAREKLPQLRRDFNEGLDPGEVILVKAPFTTSSGGTEWMWVEVMQWEGNRIQGLLKNEPVDVPGIRGGSVVTVNQDDLFDYIRNYADGRREGNETGELIQKYQGR